MTTKSSRHTMIEVNCSWCGVPFLARKQRVDMGLGKFCSRKCTNLWQREDAKHVYGLENGKKYWDKKRWMVHWHDEDGKVHVKSYARWWWEVNKGKVPAGYDVSYVDRDFSNLDSSNFECIPSGKARGKGGANQVGKVYSDESKLKMSLAKLGKPLSLEHKKHIGDSNRKKWANGLFDLVHKGKYNSHWRGGVPKNYPPEFYAIRNFIVERDNNTCQICGKRVIKSRFGHVHHIDGNKEHNNQDNLIYLCIVCHGKVHSNNSTSPAIMAFRSRLEWNQ